MKHIYIGYNCNINLTSREFKGYVLELDTQWLLAVRGYNFQGNPLNPISWKHHNHKNVDIVVNGIRVENKSIDGKVYESWLKRDWLNKGCCVYAVNGNLIIKPELIKKYHLTTFHWTLLPIYLEYNLPLFRNSDRNKLLEATKSVKASTVKTDNKFMEEVNSDRETYSVRDVCDGVCAGFRLLEATKRVNRFVKTNTVKVNDKFVEVNSDKKTNSDNSNKKTNNVKDICNSISAGSRFLEADVLGRCEPCSFDSSSCSFEPSGVLLLCSSNHTVNRDTPTGSRDGYSYRNFEEDVRIRLSVQNNRTFERCLQPLLEAGTVCPEMGQDTTTTVGEVTAYCLKLSPKYRQKLSTDYVIVVRNSTVEDLVLNLVHELSHVAEDLLNLPYGFIASRAKVEGQRDAQK